MQDAAQGIDKLAVEDRSRKHSTDQPVSDGSWERVTYQMQPRMLMNRAAVKDRLRK